jgi:hypothetical protein
VRLADIFKIGKTVECYLCHGRWQLEEGSNREPISFFKEACSVDKLSGSWATDARAKMTVVYECADCGNRVCQVCFMHVSRASCHRSPRHVQGFALKVNPASFRPFS